MSGIRHLKHGPALHCTAAAAPHYFRREAHRAAKTQTTSKKKKMRWIRRKTSYAAFLLVCILGNHLVKAPNSIHKHKLPPEVFYPKWEHTNDDPDNLIHTVVPHRYTENYKHYGTTGGKSLSCNGSKIKKPCTQPFKHKHQYGQKRADRHMFANVQKHIHLFQHQQESTWEKFTTTTKTKIWDKSDINL